MEKDKLGIVFLVLSLVSVGYTTQSAFGGADPTSVSINDVSMFEGNGPGTTELVFTITVTNFFTDTVTVDYLTAGDTATEGTDYFGGGTSFIINSDGDQDGVTSALVAIEVFGDTDFEDDETFFVNLSNCDGCTIIDGLGIGTIVNDDEPLPDPTLYGIGFSGQNGPSQLYTIDVSTGDATPIGDGIGFERCSAMDFDSLTGTLYALCERDNGSDLSVLITINTLTGIGTEIGRTFAEDIEDLSFGVMTDMSFRNSDNTLYAHAEQNDNIVTIDITTGQATDLSDADFVGCAGNALAFSPEDTLYLAACTELITIDQTTGGFIDSVTNVVDVNRVNGMDFDPVSGVLFGIHNEGEGGSDNSLATIDVSDFSIMTQVPTENGMDAIAVFTSPCEPGFVFDQETEECVAPTEPEPASETAYVSGSTSFGVNLEAGAIGTVDFESETITQIGDRVVTEGGLSGLTFDSNGDLFGSSVFGGSFSPSTLYQIDPITGDVIFSSNILIDNGEGTNPLKIRDLATQPGTDVLFGLGGVIEGSIFGCDSVDFENPGNSIFTIDKSNGAATCIGILEIEGVSGAKFGGIAFAPDGTLYATGNGCLDNGDGCDFVNFLASFDAGASFTEFFQEIQDFLDGLGIRASDNAFYGTAPDGDSVHSIVIDEFETPAVAGVGDSPSDITFSPFSAPTETLASGTGGEGYEGPTLGEFDDGRLILSNGFCFDKFCLDVLDYFNHLPIQQVDSGTTHTISMTAYCSAGSNRCNYASVGAAPPGTDINSVDWNVMLKRTGNSNDWQVTKVDPNGMLGDVTGTVQVVDASRIQYTFNIQFITPASIGTVDGNAEPPEDNMILVTEIRDSNGGSGRNIFNEGVFVNDIYAYPQVDASYLPSVKVASLCLNEDPTDRNTCAFEQVRQWAIKQAEEKLKEIYEQNNYKAD